MYSLHYTWQAFLPKRRAIRTKERLYLANANDEPCWKSASRYRKILGDKQMLEADEFNLGFREVTVRM